MNTFINSHSTYYHSDYLSERINNYHSVSIPSSETSESAVKIAKSHFIHVMQMHTLPNDRQYSSDSTLKKWVVESQLKVVQVIKRYPNCPILVQSLDETIGINDCDRASVLTAKLLFPHGIPSTLQELNTAQKKFIYEYGAADLMLFLGEISTLHKTMHKEVSDRMLKEALPGNRQTLFSAIPKEALICAKEVFSSQRHSNQIQPVLVVFGACHDFSALCAAEEISHETINALPGMYSEVQLESATKIENPRFIHIMQMHALPHDRQYSLNHAQKECVVESQLRVVQSIKRYPCCPVLTESLDENIGINDCDRASVLTAKLLFPHGIPSTLQELSNAQKKFIYEHGATDLMLFLGEIPTLHKAIHKEVSCFILEEALAKDSKIMFLDREKEAVACAKEALSSQQWSNQDRPTALIVFGAVHDFSSLCELENLSYETIDTFAL